MWIEIDLRLIDVKTSTVTSYAEVWIEISDKIREELTEDGHLLRGGVDWNSRMNRHLKLYRRHLLRGGVDWNVKKCLGEYA